MNIPTPEEQRKRIEELLASTSYFPKQDLPKDQYGMPVVAPEPDDPDDAF